MEDYKKDSKYLIAQKKVKNIKGFYIHLIVYLVINGISIIKNTVAIGWDGFIRTITTLSFLWGIGILFHWYGVFGKNFLFSRKWEENKIRQLMNKEK